jgi:hypothetical protein
VVKRIKGREPNQGNRVGVSPGDRGSTQTEKVRVTFEDFRHSSATDCTQDELCALVDRLRLLTSMTWQQVNQAPRHGLGYEKIGRDQIRAECLPVSLTPDVTILAFRFCAKAPMLCFRRDAVLHVLWLDRDFSSYDHG